MSKANVSDGGGGGYSSSSYNWSWNNEIMIQFERASALRCALVIQARHFCRRRRGEKRQLAATMLKRGQFRNTQLQRFYNSICESKSNFMPSCHSARDTLASALLACRRRTKRANASQPARQVMTTKCPLAS